MNSDAVQVSRSCMALADAIQVFNVHEQLAALAYCFSALVDLTGSNAQELMGIAGRIAYESGSKRPEFRALEEYLRKEILK